MAWGARRQARCGGALVRLWRRMRGASTTARGCVALCRVRGWGGGRGARRRGGARPHVGRPSPSVKSRRGARARCFNPFFFIFDYCRVFSTISRLPSTHCPFDYGFFTIFAWIFATVDAPIQIHPTVDTNFILCPPRRCHPPTQPVSPRFRSTRRSVGLLRLACNLSNLTPFANKHACSV